MFREDLWTASLTWNWSALIMSKPFNSSIIMQSLSISPALCALCREIKPVRRIVPLLWSSTLICDCQESIRIIQTIVWQIQFGRSSGLLISKSHIFNLFNQDLKEMSAARRICKCNFKSIFLLSSFSCSSGQYFTQSTLCFAQLAGLKFGAFSLTCQFAQFDLIYSQ